MKDSLCHPAEPVTPFIRAQRIVPISSLVTYRHGSGTLAISGQTTFPRLQSWKRALAIRHVIESGLWQLRHLPGPNAAPFVGWRASMTDEQWVDWNALKDDAWYEAVQRDFGLDARKS
jgi:hypothetical protein